MISLNLSLFILFWISKKYRFTRFKNFYDFLECYDSKISCDVGLTPLNCELYKSA